MPDDIKLPPLPERTKHGLDRFGAWGTHDMQFYARAAVLADRAGRWQPLPSPPEQEGDSA